jgi:hypothetical protein
MEKIIRTVLGAAVLAMAFAASSSIAQQQPQTVRIRGQIEKVDGDMLDIKTRSGEAVHVKLVEPRRIMALVKASMNDIKPNSYIGVTAMPQADGSQRAIAIHIFTEAMRGTAEGHGPWDLRPGSTMTNAAVATSVVGVDGHTITVKYKDGEKKVIVPPDTPIVVYEPGNKDELKPGAPIFIFRAAKQTDGSLTTPAINVGRGGVVPPM